ncbi:MAG: S1 RNA-binding domain-containing protein [Lachnospiraceae bacterium]|nr:S1 RNA-binding domain-containing protein [Lachnospiraceae bacterium]
MLETGTIKKLILVKTVDFGVYLAEERDSAERVLLPKAQLDPGKKPEIGDTYEVFLYKDSKGRPIATTRKPYITLGEIKLLKVKDSNATGLFLDIGLERDLLLPFREQSYKARVGDEVLVYMYVDKSGRLAASMKVYDHLEKKSPYKTNDEVTGLVYEISKNFGAFVAVDNRYSGLIPQKELPGDIFAGQEVTARVSAVLEDGKLNLSVRKKAYRQLGDDGDLLMGLLDKSDGKLPFTDKEDPDFIKEKTGLSKAAFKRALGHLMKQKKAKIEGDSIIKL